MHTESTEITENDISHRKQLFTQKAQKSQKIFLYLGNASVTH